MVDDVVTARSIAASVVHDVLFGEAFAAAALNEQLGRSGLDGRDRALATEIVYGVLRTHIALDEVLTSFAERGIPDLLLRSHLLVAAYQLLLLERVPGFAAVDEAVSAVKRLRGPRVSGFANALLRKVSRLGKWSRADALTRSAPAWLQAEIERAVGATAALGLFGVDDSAEVDLEHTPQCARLVGKAQAGAWSEQAEPGRVRPSALRFLRGGELSALPEYARGDFVIQEEGAQFAADCLGVLPTDRVLDVCAGRGQKTTLLAERLGGGGSLWATDIGQKKLDALEREFQRLGLLASRTARVNWSVEGAAAAAGVPTDFDRVLVDCPCSGTGTLRRRPEIALRLRLGDVERLARLSEAIVRNAARHVRPGGRLLFVVCSVLHRECEAVVERVADILTPVALDRDPLGVVPEGATTLRLLPSVHGTDGFFIAALEPRVTAP